MECWISPASGISCTFRTSPRVVLDHYIGFPDELNAPDWVNDYRVFVQFHQPRGVIAETFVQLSKSRINQQQVRLSNSWHLADDPILALGRTPSTYDRMGQGHHGEFRERRWHHVDLMAC